MEKLIEKTHIALDLHEDDERNSTGMPMKVWSINKGTAILVQLFKNSAEAYKQLFEGGNTVKQVDELILSVLKSTHVIKDVSNWVSCSPTSKEFQVLEECQEKNNCFYFAWLNKPVVLNS